MSTVIKVEGLSKAYQIGQFSTGTLSRDIERWWALMRGKEDPFLKIGETNDRTTKGSSGIVWSLKDVNFTVEQGDAVGIIGRNGAGKSTLLKVLSQVTSPTCGSVKIKGRVASLLEVGTGFHPELTGRENIFLNGAILGMREGEIRRKFDQIVDFAGVERYIDTPVKRYSSGMYVRLAFAVAAHLESEILIVDEVLAVGDEEFQRKCLGKMGDVSRSDGRTVLFVSHNMGAINALCSKAVLLDKGQIEMEGNTQQITSQYFNRNSSSEGAFTLGKSNKNEKVVIEKVILRNQAGVSQIDFQFGDCLEVSIELTSRFHIEKPYIWLLINSARGAVSMASGMLDGFRPDSLKRGANRLKCRFSRLPLLPGQYTLHMGIRNADGRELLTESKDIAVFNITSVLAEIGFNGVLADSLASDSVSPLIPYQWEFEDGSRHCFDLKNYVKR